MEQYIQRDYWPTQDWQEADPAEMGVDGDRLAEIGEFAREQMPDLHSTLLVRHGRLIFEEYYHGYHRDSFFSISSATKSVVSMLVGVALQQGLLSSLDQRIYDFFPEFDKTELDPRKRELRLRHLLSLTSGYSEQLPDKFWLDIVRIALDRPLIQQPGEEFRYDSQAVDILAAILTKVAGKSAAAFADETLFKSLGIWQDPGSRYIWRDDPEGKHIWHGDARFDEQDGYPWKVDVQGYSTGGFGAHFKAREMAKLGYLYLNNGNWNGQQLVSADFIAASTRRQSTGGPPVNLPYGYLWWLPEQGGFSAYMASGYGWKMIYVIPELDIVFVTTTGNDPKKIIVPALELVPRFIIPAIKDR